MTGILLADLEAVFAWLVTASWQASVLAGLVLLLQWVFRSRLSSRWAYLLWLLVVARLLCPALPESAFSLFQFAPPPPPVLVQSVTAPIFDEPLLPAATGQIEMAAVPSEARYPFSAWTFLALAWLAGMLGFLAVTAAVNLRFARNMAQAPPVSDNDLLHLAAAAQAELGLHCPLRLVESPQVQGPAFMGLFRPTLILPQGVREKFTDAELRFIFLHEFAHLKRGDLVLQWIVAVLQIVHWFNPALWYAFRRLRADRESATDALVLSRTGEAEAYGHVLIKLLEHYHRRNSLPALVGILEDKDQFKRRFRLIGQFTRGAYGWSLLGVLLIAILAVACLTRSKFASPPVIEMISADTDGASSLVRIALTAVQLNEDDYQAHRGEVDDAVKRGDVAPLTKLSTFNLLGAPTELIKPGEQGVMEAVRVMPYPVKWDPAETVTNKDGSSVHVDPTPTDFKRQNLGIRAVEKASLTNNAIHLLSDFEVVTLAGWTSAKDKPHVPNFNRRHLLVDESFQANVAKGFHVPGGAQMEPADPEEFFHWDDTRTPKPGAKSLVRLFVFYTTSIANARDGALTSKARADWEVVDAVRRNDQITLARVIPGEDVSQLQDDGHPLLFSAKSPEIMKILLENGADPNARDSEGQGVLDYVCQKGGKHAAALAKLLLDHGANVNARWSTGFTPLLDAKDGATVDVLIAHGADIHAKFASGDTIYCMVGTADVSMFDALLRHGVPFDVHADGPTALLSAVNGNNTSLMKELLALGVDPNVKGIYAYNHGKPNLMLPLTLATANPYSHAAGFLLDHGAKGDEVMLDAVFNERREVVKAIWNHGVRDISPLCYAVSQGEAAGDVQKLLDQGSPVDPSEDKYLTPLGVAAIDGNLDLVKLLVAGGADPNKGHNLDSMGPPFNIMLPLVGAASQGHDETVSFLLAHGAKADPSALWWSELRFGTQGARYSPEVFEKVMRRLVDADAVRNATLEQQGYLLSQASMSFPGGRPDAALLKMLLDAGADPKAPMPRGEGEKPISVIGYFRDFYTRHKGDSEDGPRAAQIKPLLDLLEAADSSSKQEKKTTGKSGSSSPSSTLTAYVDPDAATAGTFSASRLISQLGRFVDGVDSMDYTQTEGDPKGEHSSEHWQEKGANYRLEVDMPSVGTDHKSVGRFHYVFSYDGQHGYQFDPDKKSLTVQKEPFRDLVDGEGSGLEGPLLPFEFLYQRVGLRGPRVTLQTLKSPDALAVVAKRAVLAPDRNKSWLGHPCLAVKISGGNDRFDSLLPVDFVAYFASDLDFYPVAYETYKDGKLSASYCVDEFATRDLGGGHVFRYPSRAIGVRYNSSTYSMSGGQSSYVLNGPNDLKINALTPADFLFDRSQASQIFDNDLRKTIKTGSAAASPVEKDTPAGRKTAANSAASVTPAAYADSPEQQEHIAREMANLQQHLALTPVQAATIKEALEAVVQGRAAKTVAQVIREIGTPAQVAALQQMILVSQRSEAMQQAVREADGLKAEVNLTADQDEKVTAAFYQIELGGRHYGESAVNWDTYLADMTAKKEAALEKILTPAQTEQRTQRARQRLAQPMPEMPDLSLDTKPASNRLGWSLPASTR